MIYVSSNLVAITSIFNILTVSMVMADYAVLSVSNNSITQPINFCFIYNPRFQPLPPTLAEARWTRLQMRYSDSVLCPGSTVTDANGSTLVVARGNCTFAEKAYTAQDAGAEALLILMDTLGFPVANSTEQYNELNITVGHLLKSDFAIIRRLMGDDAQARLYAPVYGRMNYNIIVIWLMATITVLIGTYWSAMSKPSPLIAALQPRRSSGQGDSDSSMDIAPWTVAAFVLIMSVLIVCIYFFYKYVVYVVIAIFAIYSAIGLYAVTTALLQKLTFLGPCRIKTCFKYEPDVKNILLALVAIAVVIWWVIERNELYIWGLQDFLGIVFCIHVLKIMKLNNLMTCTILLCLLFIYDVFFVFISPLFMPRGESIMVEVATQGTGIGDKSSEMLPMVLRVPKFAVTQPQCGQMPYSLLGYGDIIVPGLLIAFCHMYDLRTNTWRIYYIASMIGYGGGLLVTFLAMFLMRSGQPALLYLVPCTLLPTFLIAIYRHQFADMWKPKKPPRVTTMASGGGETAEGGDETPTPQPTPAPPAEQTAEADPPNATPHVSQSYENEHLIQ